MGKARYFGFTAQTRVAELKFVGNSDSGAVVQITATGPDYKRAQISLSPRMAEALAEQLLLWAEAKEDVEISGDKE